MVDLAENESQTEIVETKNERIQTPYPETFAVEVQTEDGVRFTFMFRSPVSFQDMGEPFKGPSRITQARRRIKKVFANRSSKTPDPLDDRPEMEAWKDVSEDDNAVGSFPRFFRSSSLCRVVRPKNRWTGTPSTGCTPRSSGRSRI